MAKRNPMLERLEAQIEAKYMALFHRKMDILEQMCQDAAMIAAHDVLGMGAGRAVKFGVVYRETLNEMARATMEDAKEDNEVWYSIAKLDERLKAIVGEENFAPWEERYGGDS